MEIEQLIQENLREVLKNAGLEIEGRWGRGFVPMNHLDVAPEGFVLYATGFTARPYRATQTSLFARIGLVDPRGKDSNLKLEYVIGAGFSRFGYPAVQDFAEIVGNFDDSAVWHRFFFPTSFGITRPIDKKADLVGYLENPVGYFVVTAKNAQEAVEYCKKISEVAKTAEERSQKGE
jgi:hypothetical protein